ncbi:MAG: hypothetical protein GC199_02775 [Alphaproteobacteria bacterium]|nr:hypothetical protein [Alphaproteobacteria bacterium]
MIRFPVLRAALAPFAVALTLLLGAGAQANPSGPALWTLTKPNGGQIAFFGSVHILPEGPDWHTEAFRDAFEKADVVVFEVPLEDSQSSDLQAYIIQNGTNPLGVSVRDGLSPEETQSYNEAMATLGLPPQAFDHLRPWLASLTQSVLMAERQGFSTESGVDGLVEREAAAAGKERLYFESAKEQIAFFHTMPPDLERALLISTVEDITERPGVLRELVDAWWAGDVETLGSLTQSAHEELPDVGTIIINDRNARWVERITGEFMADPKSYLIVVGAGHLAGSSSVITLLRDRGYAVEGP